MPALIIALVVLVLIAIAVVVRLLIAELSKPAKGQLKTNRKPVAARPGAPVARVPAGVGAGAAAGSLAASQTVALPSTPPAGPPELATELVGGGVAAPPRPAPAPVAPAPTRRRARKMRMRDVVQRGEGVRISPWRRIRSFISLMILVAILGAGAAALIGGIVVFIAFTLEQAIN